MKVLSYKLARILLCLAAFSAPLLAQAPKGTGVLHGQVTDPSGAVVVGATVSITGADGQTQTTSSDKLGNYVIRGVAGGAATVSATAAGFTAYQMPNVIINAGQTQQLDIALGIAVKKEQVTVQSETSNVDVSPDNNASATILKEKDLEALSDDPDELEQDLLALAGPSVGPNGGQIYIDGFSGGTLPPKSAIREIRINQNPFSAMYDRPGFGRVEVFTKPGTDKWHGQVQFGARNKVLNSRNPYLTSDPPPYHTERYSGNVSGALGKKASVFVSFEQREIQELQVVDATTGLDTTQNPPAPITFSQAYVAPEKRTNLSPRFDVQLTPRNTLSARYQFLRNHETNQGFGTTTMVSRADNLLQHQHTLQMSDTQVLTDHLINETRFQYIHNANQQTPATTGLAAINVPGSFGVGGSILGTSTDTSNSYELQNYTSWSVGRHFAKFGGRLRASHDSNYSDADFNGVLNYNTIQDYFAGTPSQLLYVTGSPSASVSFADVGLYAEDDWKLRPNLTLSYGLRFESQSAIHDKADFGPRVGLSWGVGKATSAPKTVLRAGYGIFYERFGSDLVLQAQRLNGTLQQETIYSATATDPIQCQQGSVDPSTHQPISFLVFPADPIKKTGCYGLPSAISASAVYRIDSNLHAPYTMQAAVSVEQQLGKLGTVSLTYLNSRGVHQLDTINANAPNLPTYDSTKGDIDEYYSEGIFKQNQLISNLQLRVSQIFSLTGFYQLGFANADVSGAGSNPTNSSRLSDDWGRAGFDIRHRIFLAGSASLAHNVRISPFVIFNSGAPFNISTGSDNNGDSFINDRPSFASCSSQEAYLNSAGKPVTYRGQCFKINPTSSDKLIPINYGRGSANVMVNLRVSKTFGFGKDTKAAGSSSSQQGGPGGPGGGGPRGGGPPGGGFGGPRGMGSIFGASNTSRRYNLTIAAGARNLFNTWNPGQPVGKLTSTSFGKSNSTAGGPFSNGTANRLFDLSATFAF